MDMNSLNYTSSTHCYSKYSSLTIFRLVTLALFVIDLMVWQITFTLISLATCNDRDAVCRFGVSVSETQKDVCVCVCVRARLCIQIHFHLYVEKSRTSAGDCEHLSINLV